MFSEGERLVRLADPTSHIYCTDERLKSDILQPAHHALAIGGADQFEAFCTLYRKIAPSVCLWPISAKRFYNDPWCQAEKYIYNQFLLNSVKECNIHGSQTVEIETDDMSITLVELPM